MASISQTAFPWVKINYNQIPLKFVPKDLIDNKPALGYIDGLVVPNRHQAIITLRPRQNGRHFADDIFKCIFLNENV